MYKVCFGWVLLPELRGWPPVLFAASLGFLATLAERALPVPATMLAMLLGAALSNCDAAVGSPVGFASASGKFGLNWKEGLTFIEKMLPRLAAILQGFTLDTSTLFKAPGLLAGCCGFMVLSQAAVFFLTPVVGRCAGLDAAAGDLLSAGTMICGASAIVSLAPVLASRGAGEAQLAKHQALAITAVFALSLVAMLVFRPVGLLLDISSVTGGLWAGLAVNDLASSLAVGSQFGDVGLELATLAKTLRITTMAVWLPIFSLVSSVRAAAALQAEGGPPVPEGAKPQSAGDAEAGSVRPQATGGTISTQSSTRSLATITSVPAQVWATSPLFMAGFAILFAARLGLNLAVPGSASVQLAGAMCKAVVHAIMVTVCSSVGLRLQLGTLWQAWRYLVTEAAASGAISAMTLAMLLSFEAGRGSMVSMALGVACVAAAALAYCASGRFAGAGAKRRCCSRGAAAAGP